VIRAVLDTNVIVAALLVRLGLPWRILDAAYASTFLCFSSDAINTEVFRTLSRGRVRRKYPLEATEVERLRRFLESDKVSVPISVSVAGVASHPEDDLILATAVSAQAEYLVTGDRQLLVLGQYQGVQIVTPRDFATILGLEVPQ
jgi:putative PIN family toxin of toxin-antitoxin system